MAKKIEEAEVKKECPSCGLGVALDSKICEFCGWDFEEEDEWILQIEKLERDLMLEKQKFEPGSVEQKIEATLYTPAPGRPEPSKAAEEKPSPPAKAPPAGKRTERASPPPAPPAAAQKPAHAEKVSAVSETIEIEGARIRTARGAPESVAPAPTPGPTRKVRAVKAEPSPPPAATAQPEAAPGGEAKSRKVRVVRKVKK